MMPLDITTAAPVGAGPGWSAASQPHNHSLSPAPTAGESLTMRSAIGLILCRSLLTEESPLRAGLIMRHSCPSGYGRLSNLLTIICAVETATFASASVGGPLS